MLDCYQQNTTQISQLMTVAIIKYYINFYKHFEKLISNKQPFEITINYLLKSIHYSTISKVGSLIGFYEVNQNLNLWWSDYALSLYCCESNDKSTEVSD